MANLVFVDCEAPFGKGSPAVGDMTEFGAVLYVPDDPVVAWPSFHGQDCGEDTFIRFTNWLDSTVKGRPIFVSDNPAYDWQWINYYFWKHLGHNPFGHSARRIGDFYAGLRRDFRQTQDWKRWRITPHTHNPVDDARGNAEAFDRMLKEYVGSAVRNKIVLGHGREGG